jgi:hypothetical protein
MIEICIDGVWDARFSSEAEAACFAQGVIMDWRHRGTLLNR